MRVRSLARWLAIAAACFVAFTTNDARAEPPTILPAIGHSGVELTTSGSVVGTSVGYAGRASSGSTFGVAAGAGLGLRSEQWSLAVVGDIVELPSPPNGDLQSFFVGASTSYFPLPGRRFEPWFGFGAGYRFAGGDGVSNSGVELARVLVGGDVAIPGLLSMGPMLGAALDLFPMAARSEGGRGPTLHGFGFAGLQGRFDLGPSGMPD